MPLNLIIVMESCRQKNRIPQGEITCTWSASAQTMAAEANWSLFIGADIVMNKYILNIKNKV